jgi:hypothetical protein
LDYWGVLFNVDGLDEPVDLDCSTDPTSPIAPGCYIGVWLDGARNGNDPFDRGYELLPVTLTTEVTTAPEPSSLLLLGLGLLALLGFGRTGLREKYGRSAARA